MDSIKELRFAKTVTGVQEDLARAPNVTIKYIAAIKKKTQQE
jgi:hypothetical protein